MTKRLKSDNLSEFLLTEASIRLEREIEKKFQIFVLTVSHTLVFCDTKFIFHEEQKVREKTD